MLIWFGPLFPLLLTFFTGMQFLLLHVFLGIDWCHCLYAWHGHGGRDLISINNLLKTQAVMASSKP
jgi:hypothetical protein